MRDERADLGLIDRWSLHNCRSFTRGWFIPERVKVEPVVRRTSRVVLQPIDIALRPLLGFLRAPIAIQSYLVRKLLKENFVAVPAAVETEKQNDRTMHDRSEQYRPGGKSSGRAEELTPRGLVAASDAVA